MRKVSCAGFTIVCALLVALIGIYWTPNADASSSYYTSNCQSCHGAVSTCNGCHSHGTHASSAKTGVNITGVTNKTAYAPGETVSVVINGGYRTGWVRAYLYDQTMKQLAISTGTIASGATAPSNGPAFPITLTAPAPSAAGTYTWSVSWYGNKYDATGAYFQTACSSTVLTNCWKASTNANHGEAIVATNSFTVSGGTTTCMRNAPTVTFNTAAQNVTKGASVTYTATVTNKDTGTCSNSTFALSIPSETGTAANFVLPSTLSASSPNPCALAPGGICTTTLTVKAQTAATTGATDVTTVRAADATNHNTLPGSGAVTSTAVASVAASTHVLMAYNDLGMHCSCPGAETFLILPPYNTIKAQLFKRGGDPSLVTSGITLSYAMVENTDANLQADPYFANWIKFSPKMFPGFQPVVSGKVKSITGIGLSGSMTYNSTKKSWIAEGIPAFPVVTGTSTDIMTDPLGGPNRTPYLTANITAKDSTGKVLASTSTVVPVAFGGCCTCHLDLGSQNGYPATPMGSFQYMGYLHGGKGTAHKIDFAKIDPDGDNVAGPIRCSWCHWDPAMSEAAAPGLPNVWPNYKILAGANFTKSDVKVSTMSFSEVLHKFHSQSSVVLTQYDPNIAKNCYDCHPGNNVNCYRDKMSTNGVWCTDCHGDLNKRVATNQLKQPWQQSTLPTCTAPSPGVTSTFACHSNRTYPNTTAGLFGKFLNSTGHEGSVACLSCHGSPHSVAPSTLAKDNQQRINLQSFGSFPAGKDASYPIGVCNVCHTSRSNTWSMPPHGSD